MLDQPLKRFTPRLTCPLGQGSYLAPSPRIVPLPNIVGPKTPTLVRPEESTVEAPDFRVCGKMQQSHFEERSDENRWPSARLWCGKSLFFRLF